MTAPGDIPGIGGVLPDWKLAELELELAALALKCGHREAIRQIAVRHLRAALLALEPEPPKMGPQ